MWQNSTGYIAILFLSYESSVVLQRENTAKRSATIWHYGIGGSKRYVAMYADMGSGDIAIMDLRNGQVYTTVPANAASDTTAVGVYKNRLQSALITTDVDPSVGVSKDKYSYTGTERDTAKKVRRTDDWRVGLVHLSRRTVCYTSRIFIDRRWLLCAGSH